MVQKFCQENNIEYVECSAKDAINVNKAFEKVTKKVISQMKPEDIQYVPSLFLSLLCSDTILSSWIWVKPRKKTDAVNYLIINSKEQLFSHLDQFSWSLSTQTKNHT